MYSLEISTLAGCALSSTCESVLFDFFGAVFMFVSSDRSSNVVVRAVFKAVSSVANSVFIEAAFMSSSNSTITLASALCLQIALGFSYDSALFVVSIPLNSSGCAVEYQATAVLTSVARSTTSYASAEAVFIASCSHIAAEIAEDATVFASYSWFVAYFVGALECVWRSLIAADDTTGSTSVSCSRVIARVLGVTAVLRCASFASASCLRVAAGIDKLSVLGAGLDSAACTTPSTNHLISVSCEFSVHLTDRVLLCDCSTSIMAGVILESACVGTEACAVPSADHRTISSCEASVQFTNRMSLSDLDSSVTAADALGAGVIVKPFAGAVGEMAACASASDSQFIVVVAEVFTGALESCSQIVKVIAETTSVFEAALYSWYVADFVASEVVSMASSTGSSLVSRVGSSVNSDALKSALCSCNASDNTAVRMCQFYWRSVFKFDRCFYIGSWLAADCY
jgi:hypothetical protein